MDINPDMLAAASAAAADVTPDIDWRLADAGALPFDDDTFDVVLCEEAVQFFPDPVAVLREIRRVATRDGTIAFSVLRPLAPTRCTPCSRGCSASTQVTRRRG